MKVQRKNSTQKTNNTSQKIRDVKILENILIDKNMRWIRKQTSKICGERERAERKQFKSELKSQGGGKSVFKDSGVVGSRVNYA
jgi:hypothetical protein